MMPYTNSSLAVCTILSPNQSGQRQHCIDRISPHCVAGQCTAEALGAWFSRASAGASSNYGIDKDGRVGMYVEEKNRSWCTSSNANNQRAVTIECASDTQAPYTMNEAVYETLIRLCADICRRNGKSKLLWFADKAKTLAYTPAPEEMLITVHRWFANKSCPGDWLYSRLGDLAEKVTASLGRTEEDAAPAPSVEPDDPALPFLVRVKTADLNIRTGPGTDYTRTGKYTGAGVFTVVEVRHGQGSAAGWGRLKSGAGWISLDYCEKL